MFPYSCRNTSGSLGEREIEVGTREIEVGTREIEVGTRNLRVFQRYFESHYVRTSNLLSNCENS